MLVAMGTPALLWIWTSAQFVDDFRPSWRDALAWAVLPLVGLLGIYQWRPWLGTAEDALGLLFVLLTAWRTLAGLRDDLVERRRRLRPVLVLLAVFYAGGLLLMNMQGRDHPPGPSSRIVEASVLAALALAFALVGPPGRVVPCSVSSLQRPRPPARTARPSPRPPVDAQEDALLARLRKLMEGGQDLSPGGFWSERPWSRPWTCPNTGYAG